MGAGLIFGKVGRLRGSCDGVETAVACLEGGTRVSRVDESQSQHSERIRRADLKIAIISPFNWE